MTERIYGRKPDRISIHYKDGEIGIGFERHYQRVILSKGQAWKIGSFLSEIASGKYDEEERGAR